MKYLVIDASNILHKTFFAHVNKEPELLNNLAYHTTFIVLYKYHKKYNPDKVVLAFDRGNWRKEYTLSEECYSKKIYKGNRKETMSPKIRALYSQFLSFVNDFQELMKQHTAVVTLSCDLLEADDLIGGMAEITHKLGDEAVIISSDKDFIQLLRYPNITLVDPTTGNERTCDDPEFFMFKKCLRGDSVDNVQSAFPRLHESKMREAFADPFKKANLLAATWTMLDPNTGETKEMEVKKLFEENKYLMDLTAQPAHVRKLIFETINNGLANPGRYNHFKFLQFLGQYELKNVTDQLSQFIPLLSK